MHNKGQFPTPYLCDSDVPIALSVREAHVAPSVGGPELKSTGIRIPDQVALVGAFCPRVAKAEEAERVVCTKPQKNKL